MTTQVIGYVRRSTDKQDESLDQQRDKLEAFAASKGWTLVHVYSDDAISGSDMKRPGLADLMKRAESDASIGAVIAWDRNRLARPKDAFDGMKLERELFAAGKRVFYAASNQEASKSFASGLLGYVEHYQNGDYIRKLSRDVTRGTLAKVKRGRWAGGVAPFGFDKLYLSADGKPRKILRSMDDGSSSVIDPASGVEVERIAKGLRYSKQDHEEVTLIPSSPERVRAVEKVFADYAAGVPRRVIRDDLNAAGFRTSGGCGEFTIPTIQSMLANPAYSGHCVYNRRTCSKWHRLISESSIERQDEGVEVRPESDWIVTPDAWEAIVDAPTFEAVQARRKAMQEQYKPVSGSSVNAGYLLTGLCFCGVCSGKLVGQTSSPGSQGRKRRRYYICSTHHKGKHAECGKRYSIPAEVIEEHILGLIGSDLAKLRDDEQLHATIAEEFKRISGDKLDARNQLQRRLADLDQKAATLRDHLQAMDARTAQSMGLYDQAKRIAEEKDEAENELARVKLEAPDMPSEAEVRQRASALFDKLGEVMSGGALEEKRQFIAAYVSRIEADPSRESVTISLYPPMFTSESTVLRDR